MRLIRATTLVDAKSCKIQKALHFTHFDQKNTYISECKIVHKCTSTTVTVHIYMVTIALAFNILVFFSLSLSLVALTLTSLSLFLIWSNHQNNKTIKPLATTDLSSIAIATDLSSIATKPLRSLIAFLCFSLIDQWVSSWMRLIWLSFVSRCLINEFQVKWVMIWLSFISRCLISGFSGRGIDLAGLNGLAFLNDGGWVWNDHW